MKTAVYAIAKNEIQNCARWMESVAGCDEIVVVDTGSTDGTAERLQELGAKVIRQSFSPWRFDSARNFALEQVSDNVDVCIALDLDQRLNPMFQELLEKYWKSDFTILNYPMVEAHNEEKQIQEVSLGFKIHRRSGVRWQYPIHEGLVWDKAAVVGWCPEILVRHERPLDQQNDYTSTLEFWRKQEPTNPHFTFYLGKEYFFKHRFQEAQTQFESFIEQTTFKENVHRGVIFGYLAICAEVLRHNDDETIQYLIKAAAENPRCREHWYALALKFEQVGNFPNAFSAAFNAINCKEMSASLVIVPDAWSSAPQECFRRVAHRLGINLEA